MSWTSFATLLPTTLVVSAVLAWWFTEPKTAHLNLIVAVGGLLFCWAVAPELGSDFPASLYASCVNAAPLFSLDRFVLDNAGMFLTGLALTWLMRRAVQTLWKPVPELINILGVDVPDAPDVMLAGIGPDKATVNWARPHPNKPVQKFLIQVNGVVVGESPANHETAITVTGLKPDHFYNVRVIAVGSNNFQAGSRVIRLRTFGRDGKPQLGTSRLPPSFELDDQQPPHADHGEENGTPRGPMASIETATAPEPGTSLAREGSSAGPGPRRNTVGRRHSPSTASMDQQPGRKDSTSQPDAALRELGEKFDSIRKETEETTALIAKEEEDHRKLMEELEQERKRKKAEQKKKEEQTEKLKKELNTTDRAMRAAIQRKAQKEKELKARQADRSRYRDNVAKWEKQTEEWRKEEGDFVERKKQIEDEGRAKVWKLRGDKEDLQQECSRLETELKAKREQVKRLEDERKSLPGAEEDAEWKEKDMELRREWQRREREWQAKIHQEVRKGNFLDENLQALQLQLQQIPQANYHIFNQANASPVDVDSTAGQMKRGSRNGSSLSHAAASPAPAFSVADTGFPPGTRLGGANAPRPPLGFAPFGGDAQADAGEGIDEAGMAALMGGAPLSPSATALLPSGIFADDADDEPLSPVDEVSRQSPFAPVQTATPERETQSPASSPRSTSIFSSPHESAQNLAFAQFSKDHSDGRSLRSLSGVFSSPLAPPAQPATNKFGGLFSFQRSRAATKAPEEGPALGTLKHGQSQSFPRNDDADGIAKRRISLSNWNVFNRNSAGPDTLDTLGPSSRGFSARNLFGSRATTGIFTERGPGSPRPASIASSELPRPSTDSGSIWGPHDAILGKQSRIWSMEPGWSRNPSRRPSLHGSPSQLKTTLASADDEILDEQALLDPQVSPSQVGIIGSRPPNSKKAAAAAAASLAKTLNPAAPSFMGSIFRPKSEKDSGRDKTKARDKEKPKPRDPNGKARGAAPNPDGAPSLDESPSEPRMSRDSFSLHTQTSVSESRESLSLDRPLSNTPSDPTAGGVGTGFKEGPDNVVRKLFRKGSSSKFSFSSRLGGKKGPGSVTNSDKNLPSEHRSSFGDLEDGGDEARGGGCSGGGCGSGSGGLGRSFDSVTRSPSLGPSTSLGSIKSRDKAEGPGSVGRIGGWRFGIKKKGSTRDRESLEIDRDKFDPDTVAEEEQGAPQ